MAYWKGRFSINNFSMSNLWTTLYIYLFKLERFKFPLHRKEWPLTSTVLKKSFFLFHKSKQIIQVRNSMRVRVNDDRIHWCVNYRFKASCIRVYMQLILNITSRCLECPQSLSFPLHFLDDQAAWLWITIDVVCSKHFIMPEFLCHTHKSIGLYPYLICRRKELRPRH